jgi:cell division protein ZipA
MDNSTFRWILIIVGAAILVGLFLFGNPERKRTPRASRKRKRATRTHARTRREPTLSATDAAEEAVPGEAGSAEQVELEIGQRDEPEPPMPPQPPPDKIVTLYLQARDNHRISGVDLLDAALKAGMVFGDRDIFHRVADDDSEDIIFSMANLTKPGYFDKTAWNTLETIGVTMFMTLPGPMSALDAWDAMLATSRRIAELLHADLLDDNRSTFTRQREGQIREELRGYERSKRPEA